jgi:hypothetical protein
MQALRMGAVMSTAFVIARQRSKLLADAALVKRKSAVRKAKRRNVLSNLKKLIVRHSMVIALVASSLVIGFMLALVILWSLMTSGPVQGNSGQRISIADTSMNFPKTQQPNIPVAVVISLPVMDTSTLLLSPVAASGDELIPSLKLSSEITFNQPHLKKD